MSYTEKTVTTKTREGSPNLDPITDAHPVRIRLVPASVPH